MIQAFSPDGTNQPFNVWILPRRPYGSQYFLYSQVLDTMTEVITINAVAIS
jgi:hypothetical protein